VKNTEADVEKAGEELAVARWKHLDLVTISYHLLGYRRRKLLLSQTFSDIRLHDEPLNTVTKNVKPSAGFTHIFHDIR